MLCILMNRLHNMQLAAWLPRKMLALACSINAWISLMSSTGPKTSSKPLCKIIAWPNFPHHNIWAMTLHWPIQHPTGCCIRILCGPAAGALPRKILALACSVNVQIMQNACMGPISYAIIFRQWPCAGPSRMQWAAAQDSHVAL